MQDVFSVTYGTNNYPKFLKKTVVAKQYYNPGTDLAIFGGGEGIVKNFFTLYFDIRYDQRKNIYKSYKLQFFGDIYISLIPPVNPHLLSENVSTRIFKI